MITATAAFYFYEGSKVAYNTNVLVDYKVSQLSGVVTCDLKAYASGATTEFSGSYTMTITKAEVDAKTGAGTYSSDEVLDQVEQVIIDYLDGVTENAAITFAN